ncbi:sterol 26-hydroxylase, mitochondrial-like [Leptodactylus fuscus]|uniref:sterol 26-hydroxylase, mitochondrial-like n=1 Tax=Leptodactylus fuscus TaxID=238119 RepID=UPI003F4ED364
MTTPALKYLCARLANGRRCLPVQIRGVAGATALQEERKYKTFDDLPGPSLLTNIYWVFCRGYLMYGHELQDVFKKKYGPMWKTSLGRYITVNISDVDLLESVLRQEGKYPVRLDMELWKIHRRKRGLGLGPFTEEGQRWHSLRTVLNKRMLKPKESVLYTEVINEVVTDFLEMLDDMRKMSPSGVMVNDLANALYRFSFEGISYILFETRIGCLQKVVPPETKKFIQSVGDMLKYLVYVIFLPSWTQNILPYWKKYVQSWDNIFHFGNKLIDEKMQQIEERLERGEEVQGEYLTYLLSSGKLTMKEIYSSVAELLLAGVDTTSNTLAFGLYHLSRSPDIQDALYEEVTSIVPGLAVPTGEDIAKMPLLRAVVKETLRMYPVVSTNSRIATESDIIIGDYFFPKGTIFALQHYQISQDEKNFPDPKKFIPQRWLRDQKVKNNPFSSIPFGYGIRACVGRRVAELEMYLIISRIIKKYELRPEPGAPEIRAVNRIVLAPQKQLNLQFLERRPIQ